MMFSKCSQPLPLTLFLIDMLHDHVFFDVDDIVMLLVVVLAIALVTGARQTRDAQTGDDTHRSNGCNR